MEDIDADDQKQQQVQPESVIRRSAVRSTTIIAVSHLEPLSFWLMGRGVWHTVS